MLFNIQAFKQKTITLFTIGMLSTGLVCADNYIPYGKPIVDGNLANNEWSELSHIRMARFYGFDQFSDLWLQWDENYLYLAGHMQDATLYEDGNGSSTPLWDTWDDDSLEIYIHPSDTPPATMDELSRMVAFTARGLFQSFNRGKWQGDKDNIQVTGLETFANTTAKIEEFLNKEIPQDWVCPVEQPNIPTPIPISLTTVKFAHKQIEGKAWQIEIAIPWQLIGTKLATKVVGANCQLGMGVYPDRLSVSDGSVLRMNFFRTHDSDGGAQNTRFTGEMTDALGNVSPNGEMLDEWEVYQGDRYKPQEWNRFVLSDYRKVDMGPIFASKNIQSTPIEADGHRVNIQFLAPQRNHNSRVNAYRYLIRYQAGTQEITVHNWNSAQIFQQAYIPLSPGAIETLEINNLQADTNYTIAVRAIDEKGLISSDILSTNVSTSKATAPFVTIAPTGRNLILSNGEAFVPVGETALMPWLPLRGLFDQELCDEHPASFFKNPPNDFKIQSFNSCGQGILDKQGNPIDGILRNYREEDIFYRCHYTDGSEQIIARLTNSDIPYDNCTYSGVAQGRTMRSDMQTNPEPLTGEYDAVKYFKKLQKNGINTLSVFVESLDLDATPIFFQTSGQTFNLAVYRFLDRLLALAKKHDVYLIFRLYDSFYYKDDRYGKGEDRKWIDTFWYTQLGKTSPEGLFDADIYDVHKQRISALMERYKNEAHVLGWDLLNEVDNKIRFNSASLQKRKAWLDEMLNYAKSINPNQLIFYSFLTWDSRDDSLYRASKGDSIRQKIISHSDFIGMDAETAYRIPNSDMAIPHTYYAHVANPWEIGSTDFAPSYEVARGITFGFYQIRDGRPIMNGESAPNVHLYHKHYGDNGFTKERDDQTFLRTSWLHFVAGGTGAGLSWPVALDVNITSGINQIDDIKRGYLKIFKDSVGNILWRGDLTTINHHKITDNALLSIREDGTNAVIYISNPKNQALNNFNLSELPTGNADVKVINPETGEVLYQANILVGGDQVLSLPSFLTTDAAIIIRNMTDSVFLSPSCTTTLTPTLGLNVACLLYKGQPYKTEFKYLSGNDNLLWQWNEVLEKSACPVDLSICTLVEDNLNLSFRNILIKGTRYKASLKYAPDAKSPYKWQYIQATPE